MNTAITPGRFDGKVAIVTGAGSGIGLATTVRLASEGARVIAADVSKERLDALVAEHPSLDIVAAPGDITVEENVQALVAAAGDRVDVLANVAGIMDAFLPAAEVDDATWERVMNVNVTAVMRLTRAVLPKMLEQGSGSIVNVTSEAGLRGASAGAAYTTSKHAVVGFTKNTSVMYSGSGIRVNAVAPGGVKTNIEAPFRSEHAGKVLGPVLGALALVPAEPEQLAAAITWLLSDDSANVSGVVLASDGGWSAI